MLPALLQRGHGAAEGELLLPRPYYYHQLLCFAAEGVSLLEVYKNNQDK